MPFQSLPPWQQRQHLNPRGSQRGQAIVEYAGMIVMSTLVVGGMLSATQQLMPVLFKTLTQNTVNALSPFI